MIDFIIEAGKLKRLPRTGWAESKVHDPESVADHSFRVALIAMVLAEAQRLDTLKVVRMALLHDLAEAEVGDLTPTQRGSDENELKRKEDEAMERLLDNLPEDIRGAYWSTWRDFIEVKTPEARLVRDSDKLEMVIQALEYQKAGVNHAKLMRFLRAEVIGDEARSIRDAVIARSRNP